MEEQEIDNISEIATCLSKLVVRTGVVQTFDSKSTKSLKITDLALT